MKTNSYNANKNVEKMINKKLTVILLFLLTFFMNE